MCVCVCVCAALKWVIIVVHILSFLLGLTAVLIAIFSLLPQSSAPDSSLQYVNCTLSAPVRAGTKVDFPLQLQLLLLGVMLIATDVNVSSLFCVIKYCGCGVLTAVWFLVDTVVLMVWTAWSVSYLAVVFPSWQARRKSCDDLVVYFTVIGTAVVCLFLVFYIAVIAVVICYDCKMRSRRSPNDQ